LKIVVKGVYLTKNSAQIMLAEKQALTYFKT